MPLAWIASIVGGLIVDALEQPGELEDYYPETARGTHKPHSSWRQIQGHNVTWAVEHGEAVWIRAEYLRPISGNIFDPQKLGAIGKAVRDTPKLLSFMAPFGQVTQLTRSWIAESIQNAEWDAGRPWTTGDKDMDLYLKDPDLWLEQAGWSRDEEGVEEVIAEMETELQEAESDGDGDFGQWMASVRDGNHRALGAALGGEEYVAVRIYDNDIGDIQEDLRKGEWTLDNRELLKKMIEDSGQPWWLERFSKMHPRMLEG